MKSALKRYAPWFFAGIGALLVIELGALAYFNNFFLTGKTAYTEKTIKVSAGPAYKAVAMDSGAQGAVCSFDGQYLAYLSGGSVKIADLIGGSTVTVANPSGLQADFIAWDGDTDMLAVAEKGATQDTLFAVIFVYDVQQQTFTLLPAAMSEMSTITQNVYPVFGARYTDSSTEVSSIAISAFTETTWFKLTDGGGRSTLYTLLALFPEDMNNVVKTKNIGAVVSLQNQNMLLYENKDDGKVYIYNGASPQTKPSPVTVAVNGAQTLRLLGVNMDDTVYLTAGGSGAVDTVYEGNLETGKWSAVPLGGTIDPANIKIAFEGGVCIDNPAACTVTQVPQPAQNASSHASSASPVKPKSIKYKGTLIGLCDGGFVCADNGVAMHYSFD